MTPPPNDGNERSGRGMSLVPLAVVAAALLVVAIVYVALRSQPNYSDEGELGDQPAPVETST